MTDVRITFTSDMKLWTLAYRRYTSRRNRWGRPVPTGRFVRVSDWSGTWHEANEMAQRVTAETHGRYQVWVTTTRLSEMVGHTHADDCGNIMTDNRTRVAMVEGGRIRVLVPDACVHYFADEVRLTDECTYGCKEMRCRRCNYTWTQHSKTYGCTRPDAC